MVGGTLGGEQARARRCRNGDEGVRRDAVGGEREERRWYHLAGKLLDTTPSRASCYVTISLDSNGTDNIGT